MISSSSSVGAEKSSNTTSTQEAAGQAKGEKKPKPARKSTEEKGAVKVEISDEGRALAKKRGDDAGTEEVNAPKRKGAARKDKEAAEALKSRQDKEQDLVNFYAKRLVKATKELDKEEEAKIKAEAEEAAAAPEAHPSAQDAIKTSKLPTA